MARDAFTVKLAGTKKLQAILRRGGKAAPAILGAALFRFAEEHVAGPAKKTYVPVVTGALRSSIHTKLPMVTPRGASVTVGAGGAAAPYAARVHENPRAGKTGGVSPSGSPYRRWSRVGQWKYLETPAMLAAQNTGPLIADVRRHIGVKFRGAR